MKEAVAIAKEADTKKDFSPTRSDKSVHRVINEPDRQLGSLGGVIGNIRRDGGTPSVESIATELSGMHTAERGPVLLALQRTHGNRYVQQVVAGIQAKLKVGQPGDIYEQEAERVAEQVMRMHDPDVQRREEMVQTKLGVGSSPESLVQRQMEEEEEEELRAGEGAGNWFTESAQLAHLVIGSPNDIYEKEADRVADEVIQMDTKDPLAGLYRSEIDAPLTTAPINIHRQANHPEPRTVDLDLDKSSGQPIDRQVQYDMESRFGYTFENVRIHNDAGSHRLARSLNARAFTVGNDIYFGHGEYNHASRGGKHLLAHELTHVVQQGKAKPHNSTVDRDFIPMSMILRAVRRGDIRAQLANLSQVRINGPTETTTTTYKFQLNNRVRGVGVQRQTLQTGDTMIQLTNGGSGGGGSVRSEASFHMRHVPGYRAEAFLEGTTDGSNCKFVEGSITGDKTPVGGFLVSMGVTTERGPTKYQVNSPTCTNNAGKRDAYRYYVHFAAVMGIGVSVSSTAGVSGTWIMAQHDHIANMRIGADGHGQIDISSRRTKGPGGDRIHRTYNVISGVSGVRSFRGSDTVRF